MRDKEYPIEIFNEIRSIFTHLSRYKIQGRESDVMSAENHTQRAILDCFKYLCISIAERIDMFRQDYRKVDLYELAYNAYSELDKFLDDSQEAILNNATGIKKIYVAPGLSSRYFYPHLFWQQPFFFVCALKR